MFRKGTQTGQAQPKDGMSNALRERSIGTRLATGWHESSLELRSGLIVLEGLPEDMAWSEWLAQLPG